MVLGAKNTGKSTLCKEFINKDKSCWCLLDCDIGRSHNLPGTVGLYVYNSKKEVEREVIYWVG